MLSTRMTDQSILLPVDKVAVVMLSNSNDRWFWSIASSGEFSVKSARNYIDDTMLPSVGTITRWVHAVPIKINILVWKVCLDILPTRFNLSLRGLDIPSILCPICHLAGESSSHLFFSCNVARQLFQKIARWWELDLVDLFSYDDWILWFSSLRLAKGIKSVLEGVFYVAWWALWKFRNEVIFGSAKPRLELIFDEVVLKSFSWVSTRFKTLKIAIEHQEFSIWCFSSMASLQLPDFCLILVNSFLHFPRDNRCMGFVMNKDFVCDDFDWKWICFVVDKEDYNRGGKVNKGEEEDDTEEVHTSRDDTSIEAVDTSRDDDTIFDDTNEYYTSNNDSTSFADKSSDDQFPLFKLPSKYVASAVKEGVTPYVVDMTVEMQKISSLEDTSDLGSFPPLGNRIDVVVPVESIRAISDRFANTAYGFFLGRKVAYPVVANYGKLHGVPVTAFSDNGLSAISTKLGTPLMLDSYTANMYMQSWGRSSYARVMIELRANVELKDNIIVAMPKITREGHYTCNVRVEYEWKPPRCLSYKFIGHIHEECPKNIGASEKKTVKRPS
ncbi:RNA-directed DNA polymerase, eukaryota [Tanacetum coccineum]